MATKLDEIIKKCPKKMLNGPCGASFNGKCELGGGCAWFKAYKKDQRFLAELRGAENIKPRKRETWLDEKKFLLTTEVTPPKDNDMSRMESFLENINNIDAVNVVDCPLGIKRMRGIEPALIVKKYGFRPILQITCRGKTKEEIQNELIEANKVGIKDILALTGDWPKGARASFELDGTLLALLIKRLEQGMGFRGYKIKPMDFNVGVAVNPNVQPLEMELLKFRKKMRYADFAQSQAVFDLNVLEKFAAEHGVEKPILIGVLPLLSYAMAQKIVQVPGIKIPANLIKALKEDKNAGLEHAEETIKLVKKLGFRGIHAMTFMDSELLNKIFQ